MGGLDLDAVAALSGCDRTLLEHVLAERRAWFLIDGLDEAQRGVHEGVSALLAFVEATARAAADDAPKVLAEIRDRSGVLVERRRDVYGFSHLMFQEYFAAHAPRRDALTIADVERDLTVGTPLSQRELGQPLAPATHQRREGLRHRRLARAVRTDQHVHARVQR